MLYELLLIIDIVLKKKQDIKIKRNSPCHIQSLLLLNNGGAKTLPEIVILGVSGYPWLPNSMGL